MESRKTAPVGVFDSGVGGLTVAREISRQLPEEKYRIFRGYGACSIRKQITEHDHPLFRADHPFSEDKAGQGDRDRLQYCERAGAGRGEG